MKPWFVWNNASENLQLESPAVWEEEVCFKVGAISLEQTAAGQFTSSMNNAQTLGREPRPPQFSATTDTHRSSGGGTHDALIRPAETLKAALVLSDRLAFSPPSTPLLKGGGHV